MSSLCDQCAALCCRYFVLEIEKPQTRSQFDDVRWYLVHENVFVFIEKKKWYLGFYSRCKHLQADNRCGIYHTRPRICRKYSTDSCDYHGGEYDWEIVFTSAEQLERYAEKKLAESRPRPKLRKNGRARSVPKLRPMLMLASGRNGNHNGNGNGNGNGDGNGNGNGHGRGVMSLPVLRG